MRFAPPTPIRIADRSSGLNALSVRSYNERLVLSLLLQNDKTTRLEIGEKTGLSAQTVSVIFRSLETEGMVVRGEVQRGRVGPPTTPMLLNPEGAYSIGISVGHSNTHIVLIDFVGNVQYRKVIPHKTSGTRRHYPDMAAQIRAAMASAGPKKSSRIAGIGLALPNLLGSTDIGPRQAEEQEALHHQLEAEFNLPVFIQNDITAAAAGESLFGAAKKLPEFLFFYLGARLHSRLILNHQIYNGNSPLSFDVGILNLESALPPERRQNIELWTNERWPELGDTLTQWRDRCAETLVATVKSLAQFVDIKVTVVSSFAPSENCEDLCRIMESELGSIRAVVGKTSPAPKAIGAASLAFSSRFMVQ